MAAGIGKTTSVREISKSRIDSEVVTALKQVRQKMGLGQMPDQRSTTDQLEDLLTVANQLGMYDAAEVIERQLGRR